jgi:hypothetical protein
MRHPRAAVAALALAAFATPAAATAQVDDGTRPNILERVEKKFRSEPGLKALAETPPPPLALAKFMLGTWDVTERIYATTFAPEKLRKGTAEVKLVLRDRWIVSRVKMEDGGESVAYLGFDPWKKFWYWQYFTSEGRGTNGPLVSDQSWDGGRLNLSGTLYFWGEPAKVTVRVVKWDETLWGEVIEEMVSEQDVRPLLEFRYTRKKGADGKAPPPASAPKPAPPPKSN